MHFKIQPIQTLTSLKESLNQLKPYFELPIEKDGFKKALSNIQALVNIIVTEIENIQNKCTI